MKTTNRSKKNCLSLSVKSLQPGWHDKDYILLHVAFQLLVDFVEQEKPAKIVDWSYDTRHRKAWKEISALYKWWQKIRPRRKSKYSHVKPPIRKAVKQLNGTYEWISLNPKVEKRFVTNAKKMMMEENSWYEEDQKNLHRLIKIRPFLWT